MYLNQMSAHQTQDQENGLRDPMALGGLQAQSQAPPQQSLYNGATNGELSNGSMDPPMHPHKSSNNSYLSPERSPCLALSRAVSLPSFSQEPFGPVSGQPGHTRTGAAHQPQSSFSSFTSALGGLNHPGFGLAIQNENSLPGWAEEEIGAK
ncbi:uncharacterized protein N7446_011411 [Penicillium canescens]|uniref:uncharacterized protein n=1 Tax=Penicillium canescens TaxID=5083 RepID=UPI0026DF1C0F|nr:uncharacterized protein N7446_011411 [Penicillium canescens]KAJ6048728.1 hypothetical protein N7446_011411 [Penicillium canescens]